MRRRVRAAFRRRLGDARPSGPRERFFDAAAAFTSTVQVDCDGLGLLVDTTDASFGRRLFVTAWRPEFDVLERALAALRAAGAPVRDGAVFVDVGAHIGTTTLPAVTRHGFGAALAFEPEPRNRRLLEANAALNGVAGRVTVVAAAVSEAPGRAKLRVHARNTGGNRLVPAHMRKGIDVPVVTLDGALEDAGVDPAEVGLLWVDAQGSEIEILAGAPALMARRCPLVLELGAPDLAGERGERLAASLRGHARLVDLRDGAAPIAGLDAFARRLDGAQGRRSFTDVLAF